MIATAQYLDVEGMDFFSGLYSSISTDGGKSWSEFKEEAGLAPINDGKYITVPCDGTPMYHKHSKRVIVLGHTAEYEVGGRKYPTGKHRYTFYSFYDENSGSFTKMKLLEMPEGYESCGNGSGQSIELDNGELLIPVYFQRADEINHHCMVIRCAVEGDELKLLEMGNSMTIHIERGLDETSIIFHEGYYYACIRNDECGLLARSKDGLHYTDLGLLRWDDDSIVQTYNTQQHFMKVDGELYLVYTRRAETNDHVFRHRAPLFAAKLEKMRLVRASELVLTPERGARLGNFSASSLEDGRGAVMAAEWMQPVGCEKYGSDNSVWLTFVEKEK